MHSGLRVKSPAFSCLGPLLVLLVAGPGPLRAEGAKGQPAQPTRSAPTAAPSPRRTAIVEAVERVGPSVVNISAERLVRERQNPFDLFFGERPRTGRAESLGSGVILDATGVVVTNDHVVSGASRIFVTTSDGREHQAEVLGADADNDLAVLKVEAKGLRPVRLGNATDLLIGEPVIAIGNPFGLSNTVTTGILSAVHRTVPGDQGRVYSDFLQTDAAINPGNSGGALVNALGELIGINTAIVGGANTIGFAIPVDRVKKIADDLLRFGEVKSAWIGVRGVTFSPDGERAAQRPLHARRGLGLEVRKVWPQSPAEGAGLRTGDVVVSAGGKPVATREDWETALAAVSPGRTLTLGVKRGDTERTVVVAATRAPQDLGLQVLRSDVGLTLSPARRGLSVTAVAPRSLANRKGIEPGDVVLAVNGQKTATPEDVSRAVESGWGRSGLVLVVGRSGAAYTLTFPLE